MFYVKLSESTAARRRVPILMVDEDDGTTPLTGLSLSGLVSKNGGTFAGVAGSFAEAGYGQYYYQFTTGEIDSLGWNGLHVTATGARNYDAIIHVTAYDAYSGSFIAPSDVWNADISAITSAGTAGSQLNVAALGGAGGGITAGDVWDYATRTLTAGAGITAGDVWEYDISGIVTAGTSGSQVNIAAAGGGVTAYDVWNFDPSPMSLSQAGGVLYESYLKANQAESNTQAPQIRNSVWNFNLESAEFSLDVPKTVGYLINAGNGATTAAEQVWNYDISAVSGAGLAGTQLNIAAAPGAGGGITAGDVWEYDISGIVTAGTSGSQLNTAASVIGGSLTAADVWDYSGLTVPATVKETLENINITVGNLPSATTVADYVWNTELSESAGFYTSPPYASGLMYQAGNAATTIGSDVWNYDISAISGAGLAGTQLNLAASAIGITAGDVWSYATREITGGLANTVTTVTNPVEVSTAAMAGIANTVWSTLTAPYTTHATFGHNLLRSDNAATIGEVTLHQSGGSKRVDADVHAFVNNTASATAMANILTGIGASMTTNITGNLSGSVGSVTADVNVSTTSMTGIASTIWNTDISAISTAGTAGSQLNLAASPSGVGISAYDVWSFDISTGPASPSASYYINNINTEAQSAATDASTAASNTNDIGGTVWASDVSGYVNPGEAGYELYQAGSAIGITSGDVSNAVWDVDPANYSNNGTFGKGILRSDVAGVAGTVTLWSGASYNGIYADAYRIDASYDAATALKNVLTGVGSTITGNITGDLSGSVNSVTTDVEVSTASMSGIANTVWSTDVSGYTSPSAGYDLTQAASGGAGITAGDVWTYDISAISGAGTAGTQLNLAAAGGGAGITAGEVANAVWNAQLATYATPGTGEVFGTDTYGTKLVRTIIKDRPAAIDTNLRITSVVSAINANAITATSIQAAAITEAKFGTDAISSRVIAADAITSAELAPSANTEIADAVWAYATRNITGGTITTVSDKTGYSLSGSQTFDLTGNLTGNITGNISGSVGSVTTVSNGAISAASFLAGAIDAAAVASDAVTEIANGVWSVGTRTITGGTITTVSDKTGYSLSGTQSFNLTGNITGNLSGSVGTVSGAVGSVTGAVGSVTGAVGSVTSDVNVSTTSMSGIAVTVWSTDISSYTNPSAGYSLAVAGSGGVSAADVWSYNGGRTITGGTATTVTNPILVDTTSMSGIAGTVWTYTPRTITSGAGATAGDVWTYNISGIATTGTAGAVLNDAAVAGTVISIVNGPYRLTSTAEGVDGRIDILADSVQTIQLSCLDGLGAPFNIGGYVAVVNVYDVSGALAATYTPTVDFAQNGILSFEIDADITGVTGRYTLVVELTAGAEVIQLGPLEVLVRPL